MKKVPAYTLLITVMILSLVAISLVVGVLLLGVGDNLLAIEVQDMRQSSFAAHTCIERALMELRNDINYTGTNTLSLTNGDTCDWEVINLGGTDREIRGIGYSDSFVSKQRVRLDQLNPQMNIASWQEVANF